MSPSLLLIDLILLALDNMDAGQAVSAKKLSRTVGEDPVRVLRELKSLAAKGVVRSREVSYAVNGRQDKPYDVFTPVRSKLKDLIVSRGNKS